MIDKNEMSKAIGGIAWGYVFIHMHLNLGTIDILADWIGYFMIVKALGVVGKCEESALLLKNPGLAITVWIFITWAINILQLSPSGFIYGTIDMIFSILILYFHFQLLTNLADVAETYNCSHKSGLLVLRNLRTIMITFIWLPLPFDENEWLMYVPLAVSIIVMVWTIAELFSLKKGIGRYTETMVNE